MSEIEQQLARAVEEMAGEVRETLAELVQRMEQLEATSRRSGSPDSSLGSSRQHAALWTWFAAQDFGKDALGSSLAAPERPWCVSCAHAGAMASDGNLIFYCGVIHRPLVMDRREMRYEAPSSCTMAVQRRDWPKEPVTRG